MYDDTKVLTLTGVAHRVCPLRPTTRSLHFYLIHGPDGKLTKDKDGKYVDWGVEMAYAAWPWPSKELPRLRSPRSTIFSVKHESLLPATARILDRASAAAPSPSARGRLLPEA